MEQSDALPQLTALAHPGRLAVFRLLVRMEPKGARPTDIAATLALKPNTLSHHLADLEQAGLIASTRDGRSLTYRVQKDRVAGLIDYLVNDCCRGRPDICPPALPTRAQPTYNVLFICSGNSARSILAEALLRDLGGTRFRAQSAGTKPGSQPNPSALALLTRHGHGVEGLYSKHTSAFQTADAPVMDFVFTVCDTAAAEDCPPWPGQPITGHWGLPDPAKATGTDAEKALAFAQTYATLHRRIAAFTALPFATLDRITLQARVDDLGRS